MGSLRGKATAGRAALVVSVIALVFAIVGTAIGGGSRVPGKNGVKSTDIAKNAVKNADVANNAIKAGEIAADAVTAAKIGADVVGSSEFGTITLRTDAHSDSDASNDGMATTQTEEVDCLVGELAIAGSLNTPSLDAEDYNEFRLYQSHLDPSGATAVDGDQGWIFRASSDEGGQADFVAEVLCLEP